MTDPWNDPVAWREAMLPPLTLAEALKAARKAKAARLEYRGVVFDLSPAAPVKAMAEDPEEPPRVALFKTRTNPKRRVVL
jgi:hypothetical protein